MSEGVEFHTKAPNFNPWILVTGLINRKAGLVRACLCPQTPVPSIWTLGLWPVRPSHHQAPFTGWGKLPCLPRAAAQPLTFIITVVWSLKVLQ